VKAQNQRIFSQDSHSCIWFRTTLFQLTQRQS